MNRLTPLLLCSLSFSVSADPNRTSIPDTLLTGTSEAVAMLFDERLQQQQALVSNEAYAPGESDFWTAVTAYRYASRTADKKQRREILKTCEKNTALHYDAPWRALALALRSSCFGQLIAMNPMAGMKYGSGAASAIDGALSEAPDHPYVLLHAAISDYYTPGIWGGDKERARGRLLRITELMESSSPWFWLAGDTYGYLALVEKDLGNMDAANAALGRALELQPGYGFLTNVVQKALAK